MALATSEMDGIVLIAKCELYAGLRPSKRPNLVTFAEAAHHCQLHPSLEESVLAAEA